MKRAHIVFVSFPHPPHINPTLPIVSVLVRRGFRVTYVTSERFHQRIAALGATPVHCPEFHVDRLLDKDGLLKKTADNSERYPAPLLRLATQTLKHITPLFDEDRPDLVIYDVCALAGRILAHTLGIPAVQTSPTFGFSEEEFRRQIKDPIYAEETLEMGRVVDRFLADHGLTRGNYVFHKEALNIYFFPRELQPQGFSFDKSCLFAARCPAEQPYYGTWHKKHQDGRPLMLVSTSTTYIRGPEYFKMCIRALSDLDWHVALSIGDSGDRQSLEPLPPNFEIVQHTSHIQLLRYSSLFVCQGGIITSTEAFYHGVPLVVTSHGARELEWQADNLEALGLGTHLSRSEMSWESLRKAVIRVTSDPILLSNVDKMRNAVQAAPGSEEAANRIQERLEASPQW